MKLYDWQEEIFSSDAKRILVSASRHSGKSMLAHRKATQYADDNPGSVVLIVSPTERQAATNWHRFIDPAPGRPKQLANGSHIFSVVGSNEVRGVAANLVIVDEAAHVADDALYATMPALAAAKGSLMLLSSPYGKRGVFYEEWCRGDGCERHMATAEMCPHIEKEFLAEERESLGALCYAQEYGVAFVGLSALLADTA